MASNRSYRPRRRGNCPECGFRVDLRRDGTVGRHKLYPPDEGRVCEGTGQPDKYAAVNAAAHESWLKENMPKGNSNQ